MVPRKRPRARACRSHVLDFLDVEGCAFLDHVSAVTGRPCRASTARVTLGGGLLDAELFQAGGISEIGKLVAVVIDVLNADAVQLAADADPALDDVVITVLLGPRPGRPVRPG